MTFSCSRCGQRTVRATVNQTHCLPCAADVARIIAADERRRLPRFPFAKEVGWAR